MFSGYGLFFFLFFFLRDKLGPSLIDRFRFCFPLQRHLQCCCLDLLLEIKHLPSVGGGGLEGKQFCLNLLSSVSLT